MDLLKALLAKTGFGEVKTYINSGNISLLTEMGKERVEKIFIEILKSHFGVTADLMIKTRKELQEIISKIPFNELTECDNAKRVVVMLSEMADQERLRGLKEDRSIVENFYPAGDVIYIYYKNGIGRSKFTINLIERKLKVLATARNWNTMLKMRDA